MKWRGSKPGHSHIHEGNGPALGGIVLLLCLYLLGAVVGCYLAQGMQPYAEDALRWLRFFACADGAAIALVLLLWRMRLFPLLPACVMVLKGLVTSGWVVWQVSGGEVGDYLRCCGRWGLFSAGSLLCLLLACARGMGLYLRPGRKETRLRAAFTLMGILYGILLVVTLLQMQVCKWM
jgi:hypothetical protein